MKIYEYGPWTAINVVNKSGERRYTRKLGHLTKEQILALEPNTYAYLYIKHGKRDGFPMFIR